MKIIYYSLNTPIQIQARPAAICSRRCLCMQSALYRGRAQFLILWYITYKGALPKIKGFSRIVGGSPHTTIMRASTAQTNQPTRIYGEFWV